MKNTLLLAATVVACVVLSGCSRDDTIMYGAISMGTADSGTIVTDEGMTLKVVENPCEGNISEKRRVHVIYDILRKEGPARYQVRLNRILNVLTKDAIVAGSVPEEELGDDPIHISSAWESGSYINLLIALAVVKDSSVKHLVNLVLDDPSATDTLRFTLRHNAYGEYYRSPQLKEGAEISTVASYASFPANKLVPPGKDRMPVKISWTWYDNNEDGALSETTRTYTLKGIITP